MHNYQNSQASIEQFEALLKRHFSDQQQCSDGDTITMLERAEVEFVDKELLIHSIELSEGERIARSFRSMVDEHDYPDGILKTDEVVKLIKRAGRVNSINKDVFLKAITEVGKSSEPEQKHKPAKKSRRGKSKDIPQPELPVTFRPNERWEDTDPTTLVISCSDGRFSRAKFAFIEEKLGLRVYDEVTVPGGPARVLLSGTNFFAVQADIKMLVKAHGTQSVIAIAHHDCAYYKDKYPREAELEILDAREQKDLMEFEKAIRTYAPGAKVALYFADIKDDQIIFRKVDPKKADVNKYA